MDFDWKFWTNFAVTGYGVWIMYRQYRLQKAGMTTTNPPLTATTPTIYQQAKTNGPTIIAALLLISVWVLYFKPSKYEWNNNPPKEVVTNQHFANEVVAIDGKVFRHCTFTNITLQFDGKQAVEMVDNQFFGPINFKSDNPSVATTLQVAYGLRLVKSDLKFLKRHDGDPDLQIQPLIRPGQ